MEKFHHKKGLGQNFIKNKSIVKKIVSTAKVEKDTLIIEVGVGKGILTDELINVGKNVISYEIDTSLREYLNDKYKDTKNLEIIYDDFLTRNVEKDIEKYNYNKIYFIANVPYYITTPILMKIINLQKKVDKIVIMVQKEVGERFKSQPGSKNYSSISVFLNYFYDIKSLMNVSKKEFIPPPKVDSIVIELKRKEKLLHVENYDLFYKLVRDSFQFKRKNIKNNLYNYDLEKTKEILEKNNLKLTDRAENIPVEVFVEISNTLNN